MVRRFCTRPQSSLISIRSPDREGIRDRSDQLPPHEQLSDPPLRDIETNYTLEKAEEVKEGAELLAGYLENHDPDREMHAKRSKMVLGVGEEEVAELEERYEDEGFGDLFPKLRPIDREEIGELEPKVVEGRDPSKEMLALQTPDGYVVDYGETTKSFVEEANAEANVDVFTGTAVEDITPTLDGYTIATTDGRFDCDATVVAAGSHSLQMAKELGYGQDKVLLPIAGSFFLADDLLNGKVYTLQMKKLPFAAVHGDADVHDGSITRFGPTAKLVPTLERGRISTVKDFLDVFGLNAAAFLSYANILSDRILLPYVLRNLVYDLPNVGRKQFLPHVQKVVPSVELEDIERAKGTAASDRRSSTPRTSPWTWARPRSSATTSSSTLRRRRVPRRVSRTPCATRTRCSSSSTASTSSTRRRSDRRRSTTSRVPAIPTGRKRSNPARTTERSDDDSAVRPSVSCRDRTRRWNEIRSVSYCPVVTPRPAIIS